MEITRSKFKKTEVGLIPEDWETCSFSDLSDKSVKWSITGGPFGSNLKTSDYTSEGVQIIQLQNIGDGVFNDESQIFTSEQKANELRSCNIYPNEIILSKMGDPVARACFVPSTAKRYLMASDGIRLVIDERQFDKYFVFSYINSKYFRNKAIEVSTGSTRQRIGLPKLKSIKLVKPTLNEQKAIATALSDMDELISNLERLIEKKKAIKQGVMQQLLTPPHKGGKRLEGFSGEWVEMRLGDTIRFQSGYPLSSTFFNQKKIGIRIIKNRDLKSDDAIFHFSSDFPADYLVQNGDILVGMDGDFLLSRWNKGLAILNQRVGRLVPTKDVNMIFLYYYLQDFLKDIENRTSSTTVKHLSNSLVENITLPLPRKDEQEEIGQTLCDMDKYLEALNIQLTKTIDLKQGMMQELLTGKTRLK